MTVLFMHMRFVGYVSAFLLSGAVLGLTGNFARLFLPHIHRDFTIFALIPPSATIFSFLCLIEFAQPIVEVTLAFILGVLWLAMAAWSADIIGYAQCYPLQGQQPTTNGSMSAQKYCYEMKVLEALSWTIFVLFSFFFIILVTLTSRAVAFGRYYAWREHVSQLGWFGELPGYPSEAIYPRAPGYGAYPGANYIQQMPGHSIVVQPGVNGGQPIVTQMPGVITGV
ncbi:hypothetical protein K503DRAFT_140288 [Rhizopogon vinicolor AM-OR11-026]|uniref:MARVEL domain-containing protein n=1 Tax=Rhizopogon vinicolor AM-OR11-026 TaxID=1314800 RepID=A0A1B7NF19_9AGAM|nr:hypothetical protein K503DRAFT_140288 [Rhizopogon vinicolor AM-OR11-026]